MKRLVKIVVGGRDANRIQAGGLTMVGVQHKTVRPTGQFGLVYVSSFYDSVLLAVHVPTTSLSKS